MRFQVKPLRNASCKMLLSGSLTQALKNRVNPFDFSAAVHQCCWTHAALDIPIVFPRHIGGTALLVALPFSASSDGPPPAASMITDTIFEALDVVNEGLPHRWTVSMTTSCNSPKGELRRDTIKLGSGHIGLRAPLQRSRLSRGQEPWMSPWLSMSERSPRNVLPQAFGCARSGNSMTLSGMALSGQRLPGPILAGRSLENGQPVCNEIAGFQPNSWPALNAIANTFARIAARHQGQSAVVNV